MKGQDKDLEREFFDRCAGRSDYDVLLPRSYRRLLAASESAGAGGGGWLLDLGCGTGAFTSYLLPSFPRAAALDISRRSLVRLRSRLPAVQVLQGDIERLPFREGSVDFVVFSGVLHHFPDFTGAAREALRVLRPGGRGFSYDPNEGNPAMWLFRSSRSPLASSEGRTGNERNLTRRELRQVLEGVGFEKVSVRAISGMMYRKAGGRRAAAVRAFNAVEHLLQASGLERLWGSFLVALFEKPASPGV